MMLRLGRTTRGPGGFRWRRLGLMIGGGGAVGFALSFVGFVASLDSMEADPARHADAMVVLTGGADRISDAIDLLAAGHADHLLITGVNPNTTREDLARRQPRAAGLIECCVALGYNALNTNGNALETADWVRANKFRSLIVVTSNYHMPRALAEISEALPRTVLLPYPVVSEQARTTAWWGSAQRARLIAWEYLKYVAVVTRQTLAPRAAQKEPTVVADEPA